MKIKIDTVLKTLLLLFAVYVIYQIIRKLAGGSWDSEQIIISLIILNIGWTALIQRQISSHVGEHKGYRIGLMNGKQT